MSLYNPTVLYTLAVAVAGLTRFACRMAEAINTAHGELQSDPDRTAGQPDIFPGVELDGVGTLLVLASNLQALAEKLHEESGQVQRLRRKLSADAVANVSRETSRDTTPAPSPEDS